MAHQPLSGILLVRRHAELLHKIQHRIQNRLIDRYPQQTLPVGDNRMGSSRVKSRHQTAFPVRTHRELRLVPVTKWMLHADHRLHGNFLIGKSSDPLQIVPDFPRLELQLFFIGKGLDLASPAGTGERTGCLRPVRGWGKDLHQTAISEILPGFHQLHPHGIPDHRVLDKYRIAVAFSDALPVVSHILDGHRQKIIFLKLHTFSFFSFSKYMIAVFRRWAPHIPHRCSLRSISFHNNFRVFLRQRHPIQP